jgi:four helix bundle protein
MNTSTDTVIEKKYLKLNDVKCYKTAFHLSNYIWDAVICWNHFAQENVGGQFVTAADSISANIAEGFGRYSKKDKIKFYRYARASAKECLDWNEKAKIRKLISTEEYSHIFAQLQYLPKSINALIKITNDTLKV